jgi:NTP pyrophosphatase (non-canonical NTP hydrolase)
MSDNDFSTIQREIRNFADERNWEKFHTPKNLAMAVAGEAGELAAEFQWLTPEESQSSQMNNEKLDAVAMEIADVQIYLLRLADVLAVDVPSAVRKKMEINSKRF